MTTSDEWQEIYVSVQQPMPIPIRSLILSFGALSVPLFAAVFFPQWAGAEPGLLIWLTALVPAFLLTYYRGWSGASLALALGMAVLSITQVILLLAGVSVSNWGLLLGLILVYVGVILGAGWTSELLHQQRHEASRTALTDPLTQLPNRRHAILYLDAAFAAADRGMPLCVVLFDIDDFKEFNERHGQLEGDEALMLIAEVLGRQTRRMNVSSRFDGEEFLSLLSNCDVDGARIFAEGFVADMAEASRWEDLTISAGIARYHEKLSTPDRLLAAADQALHSAKGAGKGLIRVAPEVGMLEKTGPAAPEGDEPSEAPS